MRSKVTVWREAMAVHDAGRKTRCGGLASRGKACGAGSALDFIHFILGVGEETSEKSRSTRGALKHDGDR
ncbi:hypothetical protein C0Q70_08744 [Pomacea canaliculata]|uniref:Uncharacterized protein n=1 Tax=Pomacea canaliculata TaxID=400727 RepID=A0A2T7P7W6_POMCA|nr:hypothetical protein C0Q70_08744 [Pomacea canaliculata]